MSIGAFIVVILIIGILLWIALDQITFTDLRVKKLLRVVIIIVGAVLISERSGLTNLF